MPIESEVKKMEAPQISEEMLGAEAHDVARDLPEKETEISATETELSPEIIEMIMAKVQDINKIGTAYKSITNLEPILKYGILSSAEDDGGRSKIGVDSWSENARKRKGVSFFNIVGISVPYNVNYIYERTTPTIKDASFNPGQMAIIFDLSKYTATGAPLKSTYLNPNNQKPNTFRYSEKGYPTPNKETAKKYYNERRQLIGLHSQERGMHPADNLEFNEDNWPLFLPPVNCAYGFTLSYRVAPRLFQGIVIGPTRKLNSQEIEDRLAEIDKNYKKRLIEINMNRGNYGGSEAETEEKTLYLENDIHRARKKVAQKEALEDNLERKIEIALEMAQKIISINKDKPKNLLPIYDFDGNLLWPKQISYEEVKKFVAERDKKEAKQ